MVALALGVAGCSSPSDPTALDDSGQSWECVMAIAALDLTTGTSVADASARLDALVADADTTRDERAYYEALLAALERLDDRRPVGSALDRVPCPL